MLFKKQAVHDAWAATDRTLDFKIGINDKTYTALDITNLTFDSGAMNGAALTIGSTYQNTIKITFSHLIEDLELLDEVTPQIGIRLPDGTWDFTNLGVFVLDSEVVQDRNNNTTTLSASDRMCMLGGTYESKLTYPAPISDIAIEVANLSGVKINEADFARIPNTEINSFGSVTYRDAIGYIAQFAGGFATFDRDGLLDVRTLSDPNFVISPAQYQSKGLSKNESFYRIGGITCTVTTIVKDESGNETQETKTLQAGSSSGTQIALINPSMTQVLLDNLYQQLQDINFYPFSLSWFGDPSLEIGDWITVKDTAGNEFKTPNLLYSLTFGGGLSAVSKADTTVASSASFVYKGQLSQDVENIRQHMNASGNIVSEGIDPPSNPKPGDLWFAKDGPDTIIKTWVIDPETGIGSWQEQVSTKPDEKLQESVDNAVKDAADALDKSNTAVENSNKAIADAGFANNTANDAKASAADATNKAAEALNDANNALTNASQAQKDANTATGKAEDAISAATSATATTKTLSATVDDINGTIKNLATTETVDKLTGTVSSAQALAQLAADGLEIKADKTTVDTLKGSVDKNTANIEANATLISAKVTASDVTGMLNGYATQSWSQGQISAAKNEISASVETVKQTVDNMQVGGRNYFLNSDFSQDETNWYDTNGIWVMSGENCNGQKAMTATPTVAWINGPTNSFSQTMSTITNQQVTVSVWAKASKSGAKFHSEPNGGYGAFDTSLTNTWKRYSYVAQTNTFGIIYFMAVDVGTQYWISMPQVEIGNKVSDWKLAQENMATRDWTRSELTVSEGKIAANVQNMTSDMATQTWTQGKLDLTADGLTSQISSVQNGLNEKYTSLEQTLSGVQVTANNAVTQSQYTQLANQFTSTIAAVASGNLVADSGWTGAVAKTHTYYSGPNTLYGLVNATTRENYAMSPRFSLKPNTTYTLSIIGFADSNVVSADVFVLARQKGSTKDYENAYNLLPSKRFSPSAAEYVTAKVTIGPNDSEGYIRIDNNGTNNGVGGTVYFTEVQLEEGSIATPYKLSVSAAQSQITQLQDDVNIRVKTGDLINQINISTESILIAGQKVHITGQTTIDNAVIKDAMIATLSASKLTAGTIDAANINVINLNASNITTGTITGTNLSINLNTGEILFTKGSIKSTDGSFVIDVDKKTISSFYTGIFDYGLKIDQGSLRFYQHSTDKQFSSLVSMGNSVNSSMIISSKNGINIEGNNDIFSGSSNPDRPDIVGQSINFGSRGLGLIAAPGYEQSSNTKDNYSSINMKAYDADNSHFARFDLYSGKQNDGALDYNTSILMEAEYIDIGTVTNGISIHSYDNENTISMSGLSLEKIDLNANTTVTGNLRVTGSKNAVVPTRDGIRAVAAYETAETYFGDIGESNTDENCEAVIPIETLFNDTVNTTDYQYQVFISKYCDADIWVSARNSTSFTVKSSKPLSKFVWEIKARRRGYENDRLVKSDMEYSELDKINEKEVKLNG